MKKTLLLALSLLAAACGREVDRTILVKGDKVAVVASSSCQVIHNPNGNSVICTDGTAFDVENGSDGQDGYSALVNVERSNAIDSSVCSSEAGAVVSAGLDLNRNNVLDTSEVTSGSVACDGDEGATGATGSTGASGSNGILSIETLCPNIPRAFPEIIIRLSDGRMIASFSANGSAQTTRLVVLVAGNYQTTEVNGQPVCTFTVNANGTVSY